MLACVFYPPLAVATKTTKLGAMEQGDPANTPFDAIMRQRYSRRSIMKAAGLIAGYHLLPSAASAAGMQNPAGNRLAFQEVARGLDVRHHCAPGYQATPCLRWGDPLFANAPAFAPHQQQAEAQAQQFGYNNDFIAYFPIKQSATHGLLCVNHEYSRSEMMFPGGRSAEALSEAEHAIEMAAHGVSIVEVRRGTGGWEPVYGKSNRRITANSVMEMTGPAAGHPRLQTSADPSGRRALGTVGNCAGGVTPWRTYLTCEENIDGFFLLEAYDGPEADNHRRMTIADAPYHRWDVIDRRFNTSLEPHEPNRFGWVVEIDPFHPDSTPKKRTALGRFKHESASPVISPADQRLVVYMGDDEHFQYLYRYISAEPFQADMKTDGLLDHGTLSVARFDADGTLNWVALRYGEGPLTRAHGFHSQADVLIETRRAAQLLGATPMDRPEDVEVNPVNGRIYASLTKNPLRLSGDAVNRRAPNPMGYILEMLPPLYGGKPDHGADQFRWDIFLEGGQPDLTDFRGGAYGGAVSASGWLACPDNLAVDPAGNLWIATDGQPGAIGSGDAVYAAATTGPERAVPKCFFRAPIGAEVAGPCFTPDGRTLFVSVQHPGENSSFDAPSTRWPDFDPSMPPRPSIVAIEKADGGLIGS